MMRELSENELEAVGGGFQKLEPSPTILPSGVNLIPLADREKQLLASLGGIPRSAPFILQSFVPVKKIQA